LKDDDGLTCNCGVIRGGTVSNTVPGYCEFKANVRFATREQEEWVRAYAQKVADTVFVPGCTTTVNQPKGRPAMEYCERNVDFFKKINAAFAAAGLEQLEMSKRKGGSDAADVTVYGIPCVDSLGVHGGRFHSPEEYAYLESLRASAKRIAAITIGV
ncbi:MAG: M20/M25/M40 family metallo-hydrolase, partial [Clostridia bacterium]|nr:M20/M25/M40 family metallo-hydrolase [Clostridia bacterium]